MLTDDQKIEAGIIYEEEGLMAAARTIRLYTGITHISMCLSLTLSILHEVGCDTSKHDRMITGLHI